MAVSLNTAHFLLSAVSTPLVPHIPLSLQPQIISWGEELGMNA